jgi:hypothetical protein
MRIMSPLFTVAMVMVSAWAAVETSASAVAARNAFLKDILILPKLDVR